MERTPRRRLSKQCEYCGRHFYAFRKNARFCGDTHRVRSAIKRRDDGARETIIARFEGRCVECSMTESRRWFVRFHHRHKDRVLLCAVCNSALSRWLFYQRVPNPGKGYARRAKLKRQAAAAERTA